MRLTGDGNTDTTAMRAAAPGPIDAVQDFLPPSAGAAVARAAIMTLRQGVRAVLMGGVMHSARIRPSRCPTPGSCAT